MTAQARKIVAEALRLPQADRARLTEKLILSFDDSRAAPRSEAEWLEEIDRRRLAISSGKAGLVTHEAVMRGAWSKLHAARRRAS